MASSLPPIPAPARRRWREFRIEVLPGIAFAGMVTVAFGLWRECVVPERTADPAPTNLVTTVSSPASFRAAGQSAVATPGTERN